MGGLFDIVHTKFMPCFGPLKGTKTSESNLRFVIFEYSFLKRNALACTASAVCVVQVRLKFGTKNPCELIPFQLFYYLTSSLHIPFSSLNIIFLGQIILLVSNVWVEFQFGHLCFFFQN